MVLSRILSIVRLLAPDIPFSVLNVPGRTDGGLLLLVLLLLLLLLRDLLLLPDLDLRLVCGLLNLSLYLLGLLDLDPLCRPRYLSRCSLSLNPSFLWSKITTLFALSGDCSLLSLTGDSDLPRSLFFLSSTLMKCSMSSGLILGALSGTFLRMMTALLRLMSSGRMQWVISLAA